jgi:hypothetical protein
VFVNAAGKPEVIGMNEWTPRKQHGVKMRKLLGQARPDRFAAPFASVVAVDKRKPQGLGADQGAGPSILLSPASHCLSGCGEPCPAVPPPRGISGVGIAGEHGDDGDVMAVTSGLANRGAQ